MNIIIIFFLKFDLVGQWTMGELCPVRMSRQPPMNTGWFRPSCGQVPAGMNIIYRVWFLLRAAAEFVVRVDDYKLFFTNSRPDYYYYYIKVICWSFLRYTNLRQHLRNYQKSRYRAFNISSTNKWYTFTLILWNNIYKLKPNCLNFFRIWGLTQI
jgi:hypothetical protein